MKKVFCIRNTNINSKGDRAKLTPCLKGHHYTVTEENYRERKPNDDGTFIKEGIWYKVAENGPKVEYHSDCFVDVEDETPDMNEILKRKKEEV